MFPLESNMRSPKDFVAPFGILNISMLICIVVSASFGFLGYLTYGNHAKDSVTINLPDGM